MSLELKCQICDHICKNVAELISHLKSNHSNENLPNVKFTCEYCSKTFSTKFNRKRHIITCLKRGESISTTQRTYNSINRKKGYVDSVRRHSPEI